MAFQTEFPREALNTVLKLDTKDVPRLALAGYELVGYGLFLAFGDVKYLAGVSFDDMVALAEAGTLTEKVTSRYSELKGSGLGTVMIILKLVREYGPAVLAIVKKLRERLGE